MPKLGSEKTIHKSVPIKPRNLLDLPNELLLRVISMLSASSIRNLMISRSLRLLCEQCLYQGISLPYHPRRSIRLLETFLLRPDLALLVRHLEINFRWLHPGLFPQSLVPSILRSDSLAALSTLENLQSFSLSGVDDWIWELARAPFCEAIFKMKLVRLDIPILRDPHTCYTCGDGDLEADWDGDLGDKVRKLLQAQPLLEEFSVENSVTYKTAASLQANLKVSDVPSLKSLHASPDVVMAFLPVAPRLESLNLMIDHWNDQLLSQMETRSAAIKQSVRRFAFRVWYSDYDHWIWNNLTNVFALFPNTEELSVVVNSCTSDRNVKPAKYYFEKIAQNICVLQSLRVVEVQYETMYPKTPGIFEVDTGSVAAFKTACPLLETVVDPEERLWTFRLDRQGSKGFIPQLVGRLMAKRLGPVIDFPDPEGNTEYPLPD
ncbi:hypothetical protein FRC04_009400 [Tulasnella sp. 424]|nr:hypothetical protein FRC04_009400 [Tulasnella sp. 424]